MTCLGVTHSPIHRIKYLHTNSCPCWPCQGASRQMPNTAMEDAALSPTLLYLNKRLLKFCFQLTEGMPEPPCSPKVHNGKRKHWFLSSKQQGHNYLYYPPSTEAAAVQWHPLITPLHPQNDTELHHPPSWLSAPGTLPVIPLLKPQAEIFFAGLSLWGAASEKSSVIFCEGHNIKINCMVLNKG